MFESNSLFRKHLGKFGLFLFVFVLENLVAFGGGGNGFPGKTVFEQPARKCQNGGGSG